MAQFLLFCSLPKKLIMKLRCTHNSIRIRVRKSDLATLQQERIVKEFINFGNHMVLTFALCIQAEAKEVNADFIAHQITVHLPENVARQWIETNQVSIKVNSPLPDEDKTLDILIEKDFPCGDRENENKKDTFGELVQDGDNPTIC